MKELLASLERGGSVQPIRQIPRPPQTLSRSRRCRRRAQRANSLWEVADRTRTTLNQLLRPGPVGRETEELARVRFADADDATRALWLRLLRECKRLELGRRASWTQFPTGAALMARILKAERADFYLPSRNKTTYVKFNADYIIEPSVDAPVVKLVDALPSALLPFLY